MHMQNTHIHTHMHVQTHSYTPMHVHAHVRTYIGTGKQKYTHTCMHRHIHTHLCMYMRMYAHTYAQRNRSVCACMYTHTLLPFWKDFLHPGFMSLSCCTVLTEVRLWEVGLVLKSSCCFCTRHRFHFLAPVWQLMTIPSSSSRTIISTSVGTKHSQEGACIWAG